MSISTEKLDSHPANPNPTQNKGVCVCMFVCVHNSLKLWKLNMNTLACKLYLHTRRDFNFGTHMVGCALPTMTFSPYYHPVSNYSFTHTSSLGKTESSRIASYITLTNYLGIHFLFKYSFSC